MTDPVNQVFDKLHDIITKQREQIIALSKERDDAQKLAAHWSTQNEYHYEEARRVRLLHAEVVKERDDLAEQIAKWIETNSKAHYDEESKRYDWAAPVVDALDDVIVDIRAGKWRAK